MPALYRTPPLVFDADLPGAVTRSAAAKLADWISVLDYTDLQTAYDALPATGGAVIIPAGYSETLTANLEMTKNFCGFVTLGACDIAMGANSVIIAAGTIGAFICSIGALHGGDHSGNAPSAGGAMWRYTGNGNAFELGGSTANTEKIHIEGQTIYVAAGGTSARAMHCQQMIFSRIVNCLLRGSSTQAAGALHLDGAGAGPGFGSGYCGFNDLSGLTILSFGKGILLTGQNNYNTGRMMCANGPSLAGTIGVDIQGPTGAAGNRLEINLGGWETGIKFGSVAGIWHNEVYAYFEGNTTDIDFGANCLRNVVVGLGEYPLVVTDGASAATTNIYRDGAEASSVFLQNTGWLRTRTAAGLVTRLLGWDMSDIMYLGGIDRTMASLNFRSNGVDIGKLVSATSTPGLQLRDALYAGTPARAIQTSCGLTAGSGAPNNANGNNGDFYLRSDGTVAGNTVIYHKESGAWVALTTT
jgi:hypothetical protein